MAKKRKRGLKGKKERKIVLITTIILIFIFVAAIGIGLSNGSITAEDLEKLINSLLDGMPDPNPSESPSVNPSPSPTALIDGEWVNNVLLIGEPLTGETLDVHFIDVGQGDSILIEFPDGKNMLIDGGDTDKAAAVLSYLSGENIEILDYVMLTHTDTDHVGSLDDVLDAYPVKELFIPDITASYGLPDATQIDGSISTLAYKRFIDRANTEKYLDNGIEKAVKITYNEGIITIAETSYNMTIYCPDSEYYDNINFISIGKIKNNMSPVCVLNYAERTVVFTGDADQEAEQRFVDDIAIDSVDADVLKVAHHGGEKSSNDFFLSAIDAEYAVISSNPEGNDYNHPSQNTLNRLLAYGVDCILRTDLQSDIILSIDGNSNMQFTVDTYVSQDVIVIGYNP